MKVLLIGDRPGFQCRLRRLLNAFGGGFVFSEAPDFAEAVSMGDCGDMVGLICVDLEGLRHRAITDLLRLQGSYPGIPIAMFEDGLTQPGSNGLLAFHTLDESRSGEAPPRMLAELGAMLGIRTVEATDAQHAADPRLERLTEREREVLHHLMNGLSNKAIARLLYLQEVTVKAHLRQVFRKLGVTNRTQATALAMNAYRDGGGQTEQTRQEHVPSRLPATGDQVRPAITRGALPYAA
jgi:two-component system nitrate/nitrite response regulator NarL